VTRALSMATTPRSRQLSEGSPAAAVQVLGRHCIQAGTVPGVDQHAQSGEHCDAEGAQRELERVNPAGQQHRHHSRGIFGHRVAPQGRREPLRDQGRADLRFGNERKN
jgi:hypothetical protein